MAERIITPQGYPLWASVVPHDRDGQPMMTAEGGPITEEVVDFIYPTCHRVVAWEHPTDPAGSLVPIPIFVGATVEPDQLLQYAEDREEAENLARLRIREFLRKNSAKAAAASNGAA